jgi:hypothetical protein
LSGDALVKRVISSSMNNFEDKFSVLRVQLFKFSVFEGKKQWGENGKKIIIKA